MMTSRDRIIRHMNGEKTDRLPFVIRWEPWDQAIERWKSEGMKTDDEWYTLFDFDPFYVEAGVNFSICPPFEREILEDEGETIVFRDEQGTVKRDYKGTMTMPQFLDYPVKDRKSWEEHKWRFDPDTPERFPPDWDKRAKELRDSEAIVLVGTYPYGFYGGVRTMMGAESSLVACALDPELIEKINAHLCNLWYRLLERIFEETRLDEIAFWEDMAGKQGSLISPAMFRRYMTPNYRRLTDLAAQGGVKICSVDSDGFMHELTGLFIEAGVTTIYPYEVQAGNEIPHLLNRHPELRAMGGIDKRALSEGKKAIDAEIERVSSLVKLGRYIPFIDHLIPSDVSWQDYQYFVWRWKEMTGKRS